MAFRLLLVLAALIACAQAFVAPVAKPTLARPSTARAAGYVPDGISEVDYKKMQAEAAKAAAANKKKYAGKKFEDLDEWMKKREKKFPNDPGAGHTFAKVQDKPPASATPGASRFLDGLKKK